MTRQLKLAIGGVIGILLLAGAGVWAVSAMRQPEAADFKRLDAERSAVDTSMNVYSPLFSGYSADYANVFSERRSADEQAELKKRYVEVLADEQQANRDRLDSMRSSVALKDPKVKTAFESYDKAYADVIDYYEQYALNVAAVSESVAGKCSFNSDLNVASSSIADEYTKAADACLKVLADTKQSADDPTKKLLSGVETLIKKRRDAFKEAIGKEGFEKNVLKMSALVTLLSVNSEVKEIQTEYEATVKGEYDKLVKQANAANETLKDTLEPLVKTEGKQA